jgi:hypothetical protein
LIAQRWFQPDFKPLATIGSDDPTAVVTAEGK